MREDYERVLRELNQGRREEDESRQEGREEDQAMQEGKEEGPFGHEMEVQNLTLEELTTLQNNFNALQVCVCVCECECVSVCVCVCVCARACV